MNWDLLRKSISVLAIATLAACRGSGGSDTTANSGGSGGTGVAAVSTGVMTKGSVIVNGVRFEDTTANITIDDTPKTPADLADGMVVTVRGRINDDRVTGTAERVEVENEVRGTVQSTNSATVPPSFVVVGQTVLVDDQTVYGNFSPASPTAAVNALVALTTVVEVHGQRDSTGNIRASRIEIVTPGAFIDEVRGRIQTGTLTPTSFTLQNGTTGITVTYSGATTISPAGASLAEGALVEVHGNFSGGTFAATKIDLEDSEDDSLRPTASDDVEIEGFVTGFTGHPGTFTINGRTIQTTSATSFVNGTALDLDNNVKVEAEGHMSGTTLVAEKIKFKRTRVILTDDAVVTGTIPGTGTLQVLGKSVQIASFTEIDAAGGITNGERVEVRGYVDSGGNIVAERINDNAGGGNKAILQGRVTAEAGNILTILGINADLTGATQFQDVNDQPLAGGLAAFLAAVTPAAGDNPGTLVKVKGDYAAGTITVEEAELEN